jgi:hypothetical protein
VSHRRWFLEKSNGDHGSARGSARQFILHDCGVIAAKGGFRLIMMFFDVPKWTIFVKEIK